MEEFVDQFVDTSKYFQIMLITELLLILCSDLSLYSNDDHSTHRGQRKTKSMTLKCVAFCSLTCSVTAQCTGFFI